MSPTIVNETLPPEDPEDFLCLMYSTLHEIITSLNINNLIFSTFRKQKMSIFGG